MEVGCHGLVVKLHHNPRGATKHSCILVNHLTKEVFETLKPKTTSNGITIDKCIKTGVCNPGHPTITTVGMVAGDCESYDTFKLLFDPVIEERHGG